MGPAQMGIETSEVLGGVRWCSPFTQSSSPQKWHIHVYIYIYIYSIYYIVIYIYICIYIYIYRINIHISCAKTWLSLASLIWGWLLPSPWRTSLRGKAFAGGKGMEMGWCELIGWVRFALWKQGSYNWYDLWLHHHHTCIYIYWICSKTHDNNINDYIHSYRCYSLHHGVCFLCVCFLITGYCMYHQVIHLDLDAAWCSIMRISLGCSHHNLPNP